MKSLLSAILLVLLALPGWSAQSATGKRGMVVSVSPPATEVGQAILKKGGNAVDAAVAVGFALSVTWPEAGNIGGGGFMVVAPGKKATPVVFDYRESAPAAATKDMFAKGNMTPHRLVGVPGSVAGLQLAHKSYGKLAWKDLVAPAVKLAEEGFIVDAALAKSINAALKHKDASAELKRVFGKNKPWQAGDRLVQKDLAKTLKRIAEKGAAGFYQGETAALIEKEMKAGKGLITVKDLATYQARKRKPIHGTFRGYDVYAPPPPSSGGVCLVQMLNVLENFDLKKQGRYSARTLHVMAETMRRAYCDRARHLGDQDFVKIPAHLTSKHYARKLAKAIDLTRATPSKDLARDIELSAESPNTTHYSVYADGMAVSTTTTLEHSFGGKIVVHGAGFVLNNEMGDFNPRPGVTTRSGLIGTAPNQIAPGKRMLSSMTPVVVLKEGQPVLITGSPGGRTIINTVLQVVLGVLEFGQPLREAIDAPRIHHQWFPDQLRVEPALDKEQASALKELRKLGHRFPNKPARQGDAHSIAIDAKTGKIQGEADKRLNGAAAGW